MSTHAINSTEKKSKKKRQHDHKYKLTQRQLQKKEKIEEVLKVNYKKRPIIDYIGKEKKLENKNHKKRR